MYRGEESVLSEVGSPERRLCQTGGKEEDKKIGSHGVAITSGR